MDTTHSHHSPTPNTPTPAPGPKGLAVSQLWELPGDPAYCPQLRHDIRHSLTGFPHTAEDAELVATELFANACHHSLSGHGGTVTVTLSALHTGLVLITVADQGPITDPHTQQPRIPHTRTETDPLSLGGRGLYLVAALAADWGHWTTDNGGHTVWAMLDPRR